MLTFKEYVERIDQLDESFNSIIKLGDKVKHFALEVSRKGFSSIGQILLSHSEKLETFLYDKMASSTNKFTKLHVLGAMGTLAGYAINQGGDPNLGKGIAPALSGVFVTLISSLNRTLETLTSKFSNDAVFQDLKQDIEQIIDKI